MTRPKNVPNKNKRFLLNRLQEMYGDDFHPIMSMAKNAVLLQELADLDKEPITIKSALDGWEKVAQYVEPKLKAVELSGDVSGKITVKRVNLAGNSVDNVPGD